MRATITMTLHSFSCFSCFSCWARNKKPPGVGCASYLGWRPKSTSLVPPLLLARLPALGSSLKPLWPAPERSPELAGAGGAGGAAAATADGGTAAAGGGAAAALRAYSESSSSLEIVRRKPLKSCGRERMKKGCKGEARAHTAMLLLSLQWNSAQHRHAHHSPPPPTPCPSRCRSSWSTPSQTSSACTLSRCG